MNTKSTESNEITIINTITPNIPSFTQSQNLQPDNIINKINDKDKREIEPKFNILLKQFKNNNFIKLEALNMKQYKLVHVENSRSNESYKILALPKYSYPSSFQGTPIIELDEIELGRYPMKSRSFIEKYKGSMNNLNIILNKNNKTHARMIKDLQTIDDYNKEMCLGINKKEHTPLIKSFKYASEPNDDNYNINMSFYLHNKFVASSITKTYEEDPSVVEEIQGITLDQLASLLNSNAKVSIVCSVPYIWESKFNDVEDPNKCKTYWGTKLKIVAIHIIIPFSQNKVGFGRHRNMITKKVNYTMANGKSLSKENQNNNNNPSKTINMETNNVRKTDTMFIQFLTLAILVVIGGYLIWSK